MLAFNYLNAHYLVSFPAFNQVNFFLIVPPILDPNLSPMFYLTLVTNFPLPVERYCCMNSFIFLHGQSCLNKSYCLG